MKNKSLIIMFLAAVMAAGWTGCSTLQFNGGSTVKYIWPLGVSPPVLALGQDHTFRMQSVDGHEWYSGEWRLDEDTLILTSEEYRPPYSELDTLTKEAVNLYFRRGRMPPGNNNLDDSQWQLYDKALVWVCKTEANDGDRQIYLIRGKYLYDGVKNDWTGFVRLRQGNRVSGRGPKDQVFTPLTCFDGSITSFMAGEVERYLTSDGVFKSCLLKEKENLVLHNNNTFSMQDNYGYEKYSGEWRLDKDTLILTSEEYRPSFETLDSLTQMAVEQYCENGILPSFVPEDDPYLPVLDRAYGWYFKELANDGDRQIYLIRGKYLYDPTDAEARRHADMKDKNGAYSSYSRLPSEREKMNRRACVMDK